MKFYTLKRAGWVALCIAAFILAAGGASTPVEAPRQGLRAKMSDTRVAEIDFRETRIADVVDFLRNASRTFDPAKEPGQRKGINFVLNLRRSTDDGAQEAAVPPITFKARDISLLEVLDVVTQVAGLKYRVEGNVVIIVPRDAPDGPILQRSYTVIPAVGEKARKVLDEMK